MVIHQGEAYDLDEYVGVCLTLLAASLILLVRREWQLRACLRETAVREQLAHATAREDYLTKLPNRLALMEQLEAFDEADRAFLLVDLDGFKAVNDGFGHAAGDAVLKTVSRRLSRLCRETGGFIARLGGDEFGYLLPTTSEKSLKLVSEEIVRTVSRPIALEVGTLVVKASVGYAASSRFRKDTANLLQRADAAMYFNKIKSSRVE